MAKLPSNDDIERVNKALEPYMLALGKVAHAWNHMQEELGLLFCTVTGLDYRMGMGIWHALKSDRSQRDLLEAAVATAHEDEGWRTNHPQAKDSIDWILKKANELAGRRNSAIHAPIFGAVAGDVELVPLTLYGNPNAAKLRGKDILDEFEWYEKFANELCRYARSVCNALSPVPGIVGKPRTWPDKPLLPTVGQKSSRPGHSHRHAPK